METQRIRRTMFNLFLDKFEVSKNEIRIILLIFAVKLTLMVLVLLSGFIALSGDDFARMLAGYKWSKNPFLFASGWPPFQFWVLGVVMKIYPYIYNANLIVNGLFSFLSLFAFYVFCRLFFDRNLSLISLGVLATLPWHIKLSVSGLAEPIYHSFFFASLIFLFLWKRTEKNYYAFLSGLCILISIMNRIEASIFYAAVNLFIFISIVRFKDLKRWFFPWLYIIFVPLIFVVIWVLLGKVSTNYQVLQEDYARAASGSVSIYISIIKYPGYLFIVSPFVAILGLFGFYKYLKSNYEQAFHYLSIPTLYLIGLILLSIITKADTLSASVRIVVPIIALMIPLSLFTFSKTVSLKLGRWLSFVVFLMLIWNFIFTFNYNRNDFVAVKKVAQVVNQLWKENKLEKQDVIIFEQNVNNLYLYDALALKVLSNYPDHIIYFPQRELRKRLHTFNEFLSQDNIAGIIINSDSTKEMFSEISSDFIDIGGYRIVWNRRNLLNGNNYYFREKDFQSVNKRLTDNLELKGFLLSYGKFPSGISTYWKLENENQINSLKIQYGIQYLNPKNTVSILGEHPLGYVKKLFNREPMNFSDWQYLLLPTGIKSGKYDLLIRLKDDRESNQSDREAPFYTDWMYLTEVTMISSKRDVITQFLKGNLQNFSLGLRTIFSLF